MTARRTAERKIGNRVNRNILASSRGAEKRPRIAPQLSLNVLCQNRRRFEAIMTTGILRMASRRRKRRIFHLRCGKVQTDATDLRRSILRPDYPKVENAPFP